MVQTVEKATAIRVLVVDDEREIRDLLSDFLEGAGFEVAVAKTGNEALTQAKEFSPNLILLDIILPDLDGISVYESLRQTRAMSRIPVVFFSALAENMPPAFSRRAGLTSFSLIPKPVSTHLLIKEIKRLLEPV